MTGSTATVTITSTAGLSNADMQTLVDGLKYTDTAVNPGDPDHVVTLTSMQDNGGTSPGVDTATLNIMSTVTFNVAPTVVAGGTLNYTENDAATVIDSTIDITDPDNPNMTGAKVAITGGFDNTQDVLNFTPSGGIGGSYNASTGVLTLTGTATQAAYETVLGTVTYQNTSDNPSTAQRTVSYIVNDGFVDSAAGTATINVTATNDAPVITPTRRLYRLYRERGRRHGRRVAHGHRSRQFDHVRPGPGLGQLPDRRLAQLRRPERHYRQLRLRYRHACAERHDLGRQLSDRAALDHLQQHQQRSRRQQDRRIQGQ